MTPWEACREACADACERIAKSWWAKFKSGLDESGEQSRSAGAEECVAAIRALEPPPVPQPSADARETARRLVSEVFFGRIDAEVDYDSDLCITQTIGGITRSIAAALTAHAAAKDARIAEQDAALESKSKETSELRHQLDVAEEKCGELARDLARTDVGAIGDELNRTKTALLAERVRSAGMDELHARAAALDAHAAAKDAEIERLEKLVYVPGVWECAKCGCNLVSNFLHAGTGRMAANNEPQKCPNDCGPMWRKTERKAGNELVDRFDTEIERTKAAEARVAALEAIVEAARKWLDWRDRAVKHEAGAVMGMEFAASELRAALAGTGSAEGAEQESKP